MAGNKGVRYMGPGKVEVADLDYPKLELQDGPGVNPANVGRKTPHGVILKTVVTNICGSDQHMVRGRTTAPEGLVLGHEITGEIVEKGPGVEFLEVGDVVSVPFNIACGRCRNCKEGKTGICLNVNPDRPGSAYGYVDMGGWTGGQANYVMVPVRRLELPEVPRPRPGDGEDPRPGHAVGHLPDRLPRLLHRRGDHGLDGLHRRRRPGRSRRGHLGATARRRRRDRRRPHRGPARAGTQLRLRDRRRLEGRPEGADRAAPRGAGGRLRRGRGRVRGARPRGGRAEGAAGHRAELADGPHPGGRRARDSRPLRDRGPRRRRRGGEGRARCPSGWGSAGPSRTPSTPASAR